MQNGHECADQPALLPCQVRRGGFWGGWHRGHDGDGERMERGERGLKGWRGRRARTNFFQLASAWLDGNPSPELLACLNEWKCRSHSRWKHPLCSHRPNPHQDIPPRAFSSRRRCPPGPERCQAKHDENGVRRDTAGLAGSSVAVMLG